MIKIYNDGKGQWNSVQAWSEHYEHTRGTGPSEEVAINTYRLVVEARINQLEHELAELQQINYEEIVYVDFGGSSVHEYAGSKIL
jgi:hypothetical protein